MKILIYKDRVPEYIVGEKYRFVSVSESIDRVIEDLRANGSSEDIEGLITKDADQSPDFRYIIQQVYIYKKRLYRKEMENVGAYAKTVKMRHTDFKVRIQKHFPFDYPDSFFETYD